MKPEKVFEVMGFDPITLEWIGEENTEDQLRFTIQGDLEGHPIVLHLYDTDLVPNETGMISNPMWQEVGMFQFIADKMHDHNILAPFKRKSNEVSSSESGVSNGAAANTGAGWTCPTHGNTRVIDSKFKPGKKQCSVNEEAVGFNAPAWANSEAPKKGSDGKHRWWCKYQE